ncbi:MAG: hypothetical protein Q8L44_14405 [Sulfuritalea sp.]|nr:hypothetical protein [Sulfuritalea sp.]
MKFTPAQTIAIADLTAETLRYWKRHLSPIAGKRGHAPCYSRAEILALIVVRRLVRDFKMDVSILGQHSEQLFRLCLNAQWSQLKKRLLVVTADGSVSAQQGLTERDFLEPGVVFPVDVAIRELEQRLNEQDHPPQLELSLPPVAVGKTIRGGR